MRISAFASAMHVSLVRPCEYLLTHLLTYLLLGSKCFLEANRFASSPEIPRILWNPKVHYRIHNFPPPVSILSQVNPAHTPTYHSLNIHLNINLPSKPRSPQWNLSLRVSHQNPIHASSFPHTCYMSCPSRSSRFCHPHNIGWAVQMWAVCV
jgi:hypothetical protein